MHCPPVSSRRMGGQRQSTGKARCQPLAFQPQDLVSPCLALGGVGGAGKRREGQQPAGGTGSGLAPFIILAFCQKQGGRGSSLTAVPLRGTNAKRAMVACPCRSAGLRGAAEGANRAPRYVHTQTTYVWGASCPQNLGVPALLGIEFASHSICI